MGVHGLWKLLEPVGKVIPLEGMAGKVLAIDVSIWLHQAIKGMHDSHGAPIAVAHLLILFHRLCKLLFYKIKPVFVFDGGVPALKRETMVTRRNQRTSAKNEATKVREKLFKNLLKHEAVRQMLSHGNSSELLGLSSLALPGSSIEEELYKLPPLMEKPNEDRSDEEISSEEYGEIKYAEDIHSIDVTSSDFKNLPPEVRHEILLELIETRKQNSWKYIDNMPKESDNFSNFQMNRLLKRRAVQNSLDEVGKEMNGINMTMKELENLLVNDSFSLENEDFLPSKRIAQSDNARYLLLQNNDIDEVFAKSSMEEMKNEIDEKKDDNVRDDQYFDKDSINPEEILKQEELSQEEIYKLIQKDNVHKVETKLSKDRKINLTDDVLEILPMLEEKGVKIGGFDDCSELSKQIKLEENDKMGNEIMEGENIEKTENLIEKNEHDHFECSSKQEETITTTMVEDDKKKSEIKIENLKQFENDKKQSHDSADLSEESEDDFVPVKSVESESDVFCEDNTTSSIDKINISKQMEIIINTKKESIDVEDIFSDVFENVVHMEKFQENKKIVEKEKVEKTLDNVQIDDNVTESDDLMNIPKTEMTEKDLQELKKTVEGECDDLIQEQWRQERYAQSISEQMNLDAQELLRLFGVPYVVAPMEAEAQCAILDIIGITDGTITDDSDIWLFGGKVVYRNFFNQKKHVQQYRIEDIERYFKLSRGDLIKLAMLVGSDYTPGLEGVGPVTALEILGAFPSSKGGEILSGLKSFRDWVSSGNDIGPIRRNLRKKIKNARILPDFPSEAVLDAYLNPQVDDSKEPFSWSKPNVPLLQKYAKLKFGWSQERSDELLSPVMRKLNENKSDTTIDKYFKPIEKEGFVEGTLSKRVENALRRIRNEETAIESVEAIENENEKKKRRTSKKTEKPSTSKAGEESLSHLKSNKESIPQKRAMEMVLEDRKKSAIQIFKRIKRNSSKKKAKPVVNQVLDLSESSSSSN